MHDYHARIHWTRADQTFTDNAYSRAHDWAFDGGALVRASSSPLSVPLPFSDPAAVDPEEALVAATASCHMLFFLWLAARAGLVIDSYTDQAVGHMDTDERGRIAITRIRLRPQIVFGGAAPTPDQLAALHHEAHERCYIANSLRAEVVVEAA
ncbi:OsmC family protein [Massilia sp. TS11]|uniref:OsmC family protein n=1 Tax=Massilia sp. TS11 TaxID=2908003 RepID=UPI001EDB0823|nr:OsmC family protein [Massilia sp. TS11]MCG2585017.1 OsmC family protein [Massilia sp. TS11]